MLLFYYLYILFYRLYNMSDLDSNILLFEITSHLTHEACLLLQCPTCKGCCLGGLCHIINTLHVCAKPQHHCGTRLLYKQGCTAYVLGKTVAHLGFRYTSVDRIYFGKDRSIKLIEVVVFPHLSGNNYINFGGIVLGCFK